MVSAAANFIFQHFSLTIYLFFTIANNFILWCVYLISFFFSYEFVLFFKNCEDVNNSAIYIHHTYLFNLFSSSIFFERHSRKHFDAPPPPSPPRSVSMPSSQGDSRNRPRLLSREGKLNGRRPVSDKANAFCRSHCFLYY